VVYDDPPLVAIGKNASNPHYTPTPESHAKIHQGDLVLIDMWAKMDDPEGVYADITWMGYVGADVPEVYAKRFAIVKAARDAVIAFLKKEIPLRPVAAYEADDVAREVITKAGYGDYFIHRVGHNIAVDVSPHGPGANLDDYESHDTRHLIEGTSFSDEPGIYAPDFGVRSETNLHILNHQAVVVAGLQDKIIPILK
jgi:Xaa-Pro dipeptidase